MNQDPSGRPIRPTEFQSPDRLNENAAPDTGAKKPLPLRAALIIGSLLAVALATLLLLPGQISTPNQEVAVDAETSGAGAEPEEQPFIDAQLLRARQDAQDILASLLEAQDRLEELQVNKWAAERYSEILALAASGDAAYQRREFSQALDTYQQAETAANELLNDASDYAEQALDRARIAFDGNDSSSALENYELAQLLVPDSEVAAQGLARSEVLDEVNELKAEAVQARAEEDWSTAANLLEQVINLDPLDDAAAESLAQAREEIRQTSFRQALAEGFNALATANYSAAKNAFMRADQLVPDNATVADALLQVESAAETGQRGELMDQALIAESREDWQLAAMHYRNLLERDESNLDARVSLVRVEARAELDNRIEEILDNPSALQNDERWNQAEATLADARSVLNKTPRLVGQINALEEVIQQARTPVELQILSDGRTQIEIYRIGRLGTLTDHRVNIYPGEYVVIGRRSGYRDVRKDLEIPGGTQRVSIRIEADEPIR